jgi:hypothetical protein
MVTPKTVYFHAGIEVASYLKDTNFHIRINFI